MTAQFKTAIVPLAYDSGLKGCPSVVSKAYSKPLVNYEPWAGNPKRAMKRAEAMAAELNAQAVIIAQANQGKRYKVSIASCDYLTRGVIIVVMHPRGRSHVQECELLTQSPRSLRRAVAKAIRVAERYEANTA